MSGEPRVRLFAALELPEPVRLALAGWAAPLTAREPALRALPAESLHVTLVFVGWQDAGAVDEVAAAVRKAARPLPELAVTGAAWLPPRRPGVLVADLSPDPALGALHADLVRALSPFHEPETRPFRPHVTVCRVRRGARVRERDVPAPPALRFASPALTLFCSHLGRGGAVYEAVARVGA